MTEALAAGETEGEGHFRAEREQKNRKGIAKASDPKSYDRSDRSVVVRPKSSQANWTQKKRGASPFTEGGNE